MLAVPNLQLPPDRIAVPSANIWGHSKTGSEMTRATDEAINTIIHRLRETYPDAHCELNYESPHQLLVATILSAQCTDVRVNQVTPSLFGRYPTIADFAAADRAELEEAIHSTGFYRQKAKYIQESSRVILHKHGGEVPADMESLLQLSGVARKTANVVLGEVYGVADGITVDTHVKRLAKRLGLTAETNPAKVERDLMAIVPRESWIEISHLLIFHGRRICFARNPACANCPLNDICPAVDF
jgi:endonuclease-3